MHNTLAIHVIHFSHHVETLLSGLLSLHPLFLPVQEIKSGSLKEQESEKWIKGEEEGAGKGKVTFAGKLDAETPSIAAPASTVFTVSKGPSSSSGPMCKSNTKAVLDRLSDSTFDFGVVAVYSCPNSCSSIRNNDDNGSNNEKSDKNKNNSYEKSDKNNSHNIPQNESTSHNITAGAGHVYYEYIVVQPPADF